MVHLVRCPHSLFFSLSSSSHLQEHYFIFHFCASHYLSKTPDTYGPLCVISLASTTLTHHHSLSLHALPTWATMFLADLDKSNLK